MFSSLNHFPLADAREGHDIPVVHDSYRIMDPGRRGTVFMRNRTRSRINGQNTVLFGVCKSASRNQHLGAYEADLGHRINLCDFCTVESHVSGAVINLCLVSRVTNYVYSNSKASVF